MRFIDVFGPPGVGKSTLCDPLWHPHAIDWRQVTEFPCEWREFVSVVDNLLHKVSGHPTFANCLGMVNRSLRKMAAVHAMKSDDVYVQTGFAQRGLGFGWRLENPEDIRTYYRMMPVSMGVVSLKAPLATVQGRNRSREATGENRDFMVPLMTRAHEIAIEVLDERAVPVIELDTTRNPDDLRRDLLGFRDSLCGRHKILHSAPARPGDQTADVR